MDLQKPRQILVSTCNRTCTSKTNSGNWSLSMSNTQTWAPPVLETLMKMCSESFIFIRFQHVHSAKTLIHASPQREYSEDQTRRDSVREIFGACHVHRTNHTIVLPTHQKWLSIQRDTYTRIWKEALSGLHRKYTSTVYQIRVGCDKNALHVRLCGVLHRETTWHKYATYIATWFIHVARRANVCKWWCLAIYSQNPRNRLQF